MAMGYGPIFREPVDLLPPSFSHDPSNFNLMHPDFRLPRVLGDASPVSPRTPGQYAAGFAMGLNESCWRGFLEVLRWKNTSMWNSSHSARSVHDNVVGAKACPF